MMMVQRQLSDREKEILELFANTGWMNVTLGEKLGISPKTIGTHMQTIMLKLGVHTRAEAMLYVWSHAEIRQAENGMRAVTIRLGASE